jgi:hypothetical protein
VPAACTEVLRAFLKPVGKKADGDEPAVVRFRWVRGQDDPRREAALPWLGQGVGEDREAREAGPPGLRRLGIDADPQVQGGRPKRLPQAEEQRPLPRSTWPRGRPPRLRQEA